MTAQENFDNGLTLELERLLSNGASIAPPIVHEVSPDETLALLQKNRVLASEKANLTIREELNASGATLEACAETLSFLIRAEGVKPDVKRRAAMDILNIHGALPQKNADVAPPQIQVVIQSSEHVNLQQVFNPSLSR